MKKRIFSVLLALSMIAGLCAGCGGSKDKDNGDKGNTDGKVTITVGMRQASSITSYEDNALTKYIEENTGIDIEFILFSGTTAEVQQQITLMASTNKEKLPDVIFGLSTSEKMINDFGEDGYFLDLTDLIEEYGVNFKKQLATLSEEDQAYVVEKGKNPNDGATYSMPLVCMQAHDEMANMTYINKTWLDKLGLEIPTNVDELYKVCKAFATQDPNGNGEADEVPIMAMAGGTLYDITMYMINAYEYYDCLDPYYVENGTVVDAATTDEYRQALIYMNKLCKEGLLSDLCFSMVEIKEFKAAITPSDNVARVGIWSGHTINYTNVDSTIVDQYVALPKLADETGHGGYDVVREPTLQYGNAVITKDCENVEAAMKLLDFFYADGTAARVRHGEEGVDWIDQEGLNEYGEPGHIEVINSEAFLKGNSTWAGNLIGILNAYDYLPNGVEGTGTLAERTRLNKEIWTLMKNATTPKENIYKLTYTAEENEIMDECKNKCLNYINEQRALFVVGSKDPSSDADWNEYLKTLEGYGSKDLLKVKQAAYDRKLAR